MPKDILKSIRYYWENYEQEEQFALSESKYIINKLILALPDMMERIGTLVPLTNDHRDIIESFVQFVSQGLLPSLSTHNYKEYNRQAGKYLIPKLLADRTFIASEVENAQAVFSFATAILMYEYPIPYHVCFIKHYPGKADIDCIILPEKVGQKLDLAKMFTTQAAHQNLSDEELVQLCPYEVRGRGERIDFVGDETQSSDVYRYVGAFPVYCDQEYHLWICSSDRTPAKGNAPKKAPAASSLSPVFGSAI